MKIHTLITASLISISGLQAQQTPTQPAAAPAVVQPPVAFHYKPGFVISPYKPHNILSVKHLKAGDLAYDPTTAQKNEKTGKIILKTALKFRIPLPKPVPATTPAA